MKTVLAWVATLILAFVSALICSSSRDRYKVQKEVEDEVEKRAEAAAEAERKRIEEMDPGAVVDSLPAPARERIAAAKSAALKRALDRARAASRAHGGGAGSNNPGGG